jgi:hypothetical protein
VSRAHCLRPCHRRPFTVLRTYDPFLSFSPPLPSPLRTTWYRIASITAFIFICSRLCPEFAYCFRPSKIRVLLSPLNACKTSTSPPAPRSPSSPRLQPRVHLLRPVFSFASAFAVPPAPAPSRLRFLPFTASPWPPRLQPRLFRLPDTVLGLANTDRTSVISASLPRPNPLIVLLFRLPLFYLTARSSISA